MATYEPKHVLLADHEEERAKKIWEVLERGWRARVDRALKAEEALDLFARASDSGDSYHVVLIASRFDNRDHRVLFEKLCATPLNHGVLVTHQGGSKPTDVGIDWLLCVPKDGRVEDDRIAQQARPFMGDSPPRYAVMSNANELGLALRLQVRGLDLRGWDIERGLSGMALLSVTCFAVWRRGDSQ